MLTFFRRIRKGLLEGGATSKYLLYALGEIALVVIGILIALQINNWNEWRKDRIMEREVLVELSESLTKNCEELESTIRAARFCNNSREIVTSVLTQKMPYSVSLQDHFFTAGMDYRHSTFTYSGYEIFKNKGFDVLTSTELRIGIVNLFEGKLKSLEANESEVIWNGYVEEVAKYMIDNFTNRRIPKDYPSLLNNHSFLENVKAIIEHEDWLTKMRSRTLEECKKVLQLIQDELDESDL